jgi:hypothetical protein
MSNREKVHVVASGYDWECPECGEEQHEESMPADWAEGFHDIECWLCDTKFILGDVGHCFH